MWHTEGRGQRASIVKGDACTPRFWYVLVREGFPSVGFSKLGQKSVSMVEDNSGELVRT